MNGKAGKRSFDSGGRQPKASERAWLLVVLLMPVALLNYLDRQMLASMQASVMADVPSLGEASNPQELWGFMLGQFKWVYAAFSLMGGYVADRFSRRWTICASLFVWSAVTWLTGQASSYQDLLWTRTLMGFSEAFYIPAALALIADSHSPRTRSRAVGLHQMAIYLGVIAGGFGGYIAAHPSLGWRFAFHACGVIGMLYAVPLCLFLQNQPSSSVGKVGQRRASNLLGSSRELFSNFSYWLLIVYFTLPAMSAWIVRDWMPSILRTRYQIGQGLAGVSASLYWQVAAIGGAGLGCYLADRWIRKSDRGRINASACGMVMLIPAIIGMGYAPSLQTAIGFLILFGVGWGFFDGNNMPILSQLVRPELRATGFGVMNFVSISFGGIADWGFGYLRDRAVPLPLVFGSLAGLALLSLIIVLLIRPNREVDTPTGAEQT